MIAKVMNLRAVSFNSTVAFFNVVLGVESRGTFVPVLVLRDFALRTKKDGSGYYWQAPAKLRTKNGEPVMENGFKKYDEYVVLATAEGKDGQRHVTDLAWDVREVILKEAVAALESAPGKSAGRGTSAAAPRKAAARAAVAVEDDDLPF
jgi:hypothetical protein